MPRRRVEGNNTKVIKKMRKVYVGFMGLEKTYIRDNREALWQLLR